MADIVLVEDEQVLRRYLAGTLRRMEHTVRAAETAEDGLRFIEEGRPDIVLSDHRLPGMTGHDLLTTVKESWPEVAVVLMTAHGSVRDAVAAMHAGASDYLAKPLNLETLDVTIERCLTDSNLRSELDAGRRRDEVAAADRNILSGDPTGLVGESSRITELRDLVRKLAAHEKLDTVGPTVLITGETGSGKGLVARALHLAASRRDGPFVEVNCAALPDHLLETELMGYESGAFTGALHARPGLFEAAGSGTVFLDEIGRMSLHLQAKILHLLDERALRRIGSTRDRALRCSIIAASHMDLPAMVEAGTFLPGLFHRVDVCRVRVPPLRECGDDIVLLANHFLARHAREYGVETPTLTERAATALREYSWPGNVRELAHLMERVVVPVEGSAIDAGDLGLSVSSDRAPASPQGMGKHGRPNLTLVSRRL